MLRKMSAAAALAAAAVGLSGCHSNVGVAAHVGDTTISDSDVNGYLVPGFTSTDGSAPRQLVLELLVQERLFEQAVQRSGGPAKPDELAQVRPDALAAIAGGQVSEADFQQGFSQSLAQKGIRGSFGEKVVEAYEYSNVFAKRTNLSSDQLLAALRKLNIRVDVRSRYGAWDPANLSLSSDQSAGVPDFIKLASPPAAASGAPTG